MLEILDDLTDSALVYAIESSLFELIKLYRFWPSVEMHDDPDLLWTISDIPFKLFNANRRTRIAPENVDKVIERVILRGKSRNVPLVWCTGPSTQPAELGKNLEAHGFHREFNSSGMALDLSVIGEELSPPLGLAVTQVRDKEALKTWCQVGISGFSMPEFLVEHFYDLYSHLGLNGEKGCSHYLGLLDGTAVATSTLSLAGGVAGIYDVSTLPGARRRGIGAAMTLRPLLDARALGYKAAVLEASEMGASVYARLGFREYCKIGHYTWEFPEEKPEA